ncbi:hypothetical protein LX36DRAFT_650353 [Colletotrichum falcatum]|nr:hypothetical protein LX36DRAFT_650353 [Colletotrichum falcatum]
MLLPPSMICVDLVLPWHWSVHEQTPRPTLTMVPTSYIVSHIESNSVCTNSVRLQPGSRPFSSAATSLPRLGSWVLRSFLWSWSLHLIPPHLQALGQSLGRRVRAGWAR